MNTLCPLCAVDATDASLHIDSGSYHHCGNCDLVFLAPHLRLDRAAEHAYYLTHENNVDDPRYRKFLSQLSEPLIQRLQPGARGLDYGAGPGPALAEMLNEAGFPTRIHDPKFAPNPQALQQQYDFITCTEVVEHMHAPGREFARFEAMLKRGGWLAVMTELRPAMEDFARWHYLRDPTHVCFYSLRTIEWITQQFSWQLDFINTRVILWQTP